MTGPGKAVTVSATLEADALLLCHRGDEQKEKKKFSPDFSTVLNFAI